MKKFLLLCATSLMLLMAGCGEFDATGIWDAIEDLTQRVEDLEEECQKMNTNIEALQALVGAQQSGDTITSIAPIKQGDEVIGYTITFSQSEPITIYHGTNGKDGANGEDGKDGADGYTPVIGVAQDEDGIYYWTLDGEWLLDDTGNKIKAVGTDGKDGADGENGANGNDGANGEDGKDGENGADGKDGEDGITPQLEIRDGYWYISYDNGATWKELGKATGEDGKDGENGQDGTNGTDGKDGDSLFQSVTWDEEFVYFTLSDGTVIAIPLSSATEKPEPEEPAGDTYGLMGDFEGNNWTSDIALVADGDYLVAQDVVFANANEEGLVFKVRKNADWTTSYGTSSASAFELNTEISLNGDGNISINGEVGVKYDFYFSLETMTIWVMADGETPSVSEEPVEPVVDTYGLMGDFEGNNWSTDIALVADGDYLVAQDVVFANANEEGLVFKVRKNADWATSFGTSSESAFELNTGIALDGGLNIMVNGEAGVKYDFYFSLETMTIWVMADGETPSVSEEPEEPVADTYGLMGDFEGNNWSTDIALVADGDYLVAQDVVFANANNEGLAFKVRKNADWTTSYGTSSSSAFELHAEIALDGDSNILVNGEVGAKYDIYFALATMQVWVMTDGAKPGDAHPEPETGVVKATVQEFLNAAEDETVYELTGEITGTYNTNYGNFYLKDATGEVLIYGLYQDGEKCYTALGLVDGDTITIQGARASYNGTAQMKNAEYISHVVNTTPRIISVDTEKVSISADGGAKTITVTTAGEGGTLAATANAEWVSVAVEGNAVTATIAANEGEAREATITITFGEDSATVAVAQDAPIAEGTEVTYVWTLAKGDLTTAGGTITKGEPSLDWTQTTATYVGWDSNNGKGVQIGSGSKPATTFTLSTSGIEGTISSIVVNSSIANSGDATLTIKVGDTAYLDGQALTTTATDYTATVDATGDVEISFAATAKAYYLKSVTITYVK